MYASVIGAYICMDMRIKDKRFQPLKPSKAA